METLNYDTLEKSGYDGFLLKSAPVRVLQFGEGNFLRGFADYFIDIANEKADFDSKVTIVQPVPFGNIEPVFNGQQGLYTLYLRGFENGGAVDEKRIISAIDGYINPYNDFDGFLKAAENPELRYIVSNTTEAGIAYDSSCRFGDEPPASFPAKLTRFLHKRWSCGGGGLVILSCELIDNNGEKLREIAEKYVRDWQLEPEFSKWLGRECQFCSTLVDRIVTGYPADEADKLNSENGYVDGLLDVGESFGLWVIEGSEELRAELPFERAGLPVKVVADHSPYKRQKVRILNGAHTSMVYAAYLCGEDFVRESVLDGDIGAFLKAVIYDEILPIEGLPVSETMDFAASVLERFQNPFTHHKLLSIAMNATSKWSARVLPSIKDYTARENKLPKRLTFSLAACISFLHGETVRDGRIYGKRDNGEYEIQEDAEALSFIEANMDADAVEFGRRILSRTELWGEELSAIPGFADSTAAYLEDIKKSGMREALRKVNG